MDEKFSVMDMSSSLYDDSYSHSRGFFSATKVYAPKCKSSGSIVQIQCNMQVIQWVHCLREKHRWSIKLSVRLFSEQFSETFKSRSVVSSFTSLWFPIWRSDHSRKSVLLVLLHFSAQILWYVCRLFDFYICRVFSSASFYMVPVCTVPLCTVPISLHIGTLVVSVEGVTIFNSGIRYVVNLHVFEF